MPPAELFGDVKRKEEDNDCLKNKLLCICRDMCSNCLLGNHFVHRCIDKPASPGVELLGFDLGEVFIGERKMRKTLENLLNQAAREMDCPQMDEVAAFLLANGVIVPPVKIGQTVYSVLIYDPEDELDKSFIEEYTVDGVAYIEGEWYVFDERDHELYKVGTEYCQLTRADAEKVLAERGKK